MMAIYLWILESALAQKDGHMPTVGVGVKELPLVRLAHPQDLLRGPVGLIRSDTVV